MDSASIVVYLGHGNGWPSIYSSVLRPTVMDGLGLNPVAGVDDEAHQYFGETYLRKYVRLAPGAAVILSHLCYASGAAEPGMANPTLDTAVKRVDNFGAGFLAAGAAAVVAEAHGGPAWYLNAIFRGQGTIESIWRSHPSFHGHLQAFAGVRSAGARLYLDPDRPASGYHRSLVVKPGVRTADILAGAPAGWTVTEPAGGDTAPALSLVARGASPVRVRLAGTLVAGGDATLNLVFDSRTAALLPAAFTIGTRWNLLAADATVPAAASPSAAPSSAAPSPSPDAGAWTSPASATPDATAPGDAANPAATPAPAADVPDLPTPVATAPAATEVPAETPAAPSAAAETPVPGEPSPSDDEPVMAPDPREVDLVKEEVTGTLVTVSPASASTRKPSVSVAVPSRPGLYRLVITLHDASGVAYEAATQELFPALVVQVTGPLWAVYGTPDQVSIGPGGRLDVRVEVANTGSEPWGARPTESLVDPAPILAADPPLLVARWVSLDGTGDPGGAPPPAGTVPAYVDPGTSTTLEMVLDAPDAAGQYLLLFDVLLPDGRSLAAAGVPPGIVRVAVGAGQADAPSDSPPASSAPASPAPGSPPPGHSSQPSS
jgi:hypothetical protein